MRLEIELELDNAAFQDSPDEVKRILSELAEVLPFPPHATRLPGGVYNLHDSNGNHVGEAVIVNEDDE